jgi:Zn-dependent peptidase ImmA (M78 family)
VLLVGNLGSHHTALKVETFRGFALADDLAPFVVINDQDARSAWSFTLLHEVAHLWLGQTGVSGGYGESSIERFCNDVASSILLTGDELATFDFAAGDHTVAEYVTLIGEFARERKVSTALVAYRAMRAGYLNQSGWKVVQDQLRANWATARAADRARRTDSESGPNYYTVRRHRVGPALINFVRRNVAEGELTTVKAGRVLGVQPKNVGPLLAEPPPRMRRAS